MINESACYFCQYQELIELHTRRKDKKLFLFPASYTEQLISVYLVPFKKIKPFLDSTQSAKEHYFIKAFRYIPHTCICF